MRRIILGSVALTISLFGAGLILGIATAMAQTAPSTTSSPTDVERAAIDALNRGDVTRWLGLMTGDAVIEGFPDCAVPCSGSAAIRREIDAIVAARVHVTATSTDVSGNIVTSHFEATSDVLRTLGYARVLGTFTITVRGDKISAASFTLDESDPETARFLAQYGRLIQPAPNPTPGQRVLPGTGSGPHARNGRDIILASMLVGSTLLLAGLAARHASRRMRESK